jgi:hypothetical protein
MSTGTRVAGFVAGLAAVFAVMLGVGNAVGPVAVEPVAPHDEVHDSGGDSGHDSGGDSAGHADAAAAAEPVAVPGGLMVSQDGYTLRLDDQQEQPGRAVPVTFTITGPDGVPVTAYDVEHEKRLHLIAVRRDLTGFQHVHPVLADDGRWSTALDLTAGQWRVFADFAPTGAQPLTLGADLAVGGRYLPVGTQPDSRVAEVDGYTVTLDGDLATGGDARLTLSVTRDGRPVTRLQPYLGAYGHLVALRAGDLAYLHVHPDGSPGDGHTPAGPDVVFHAAVPSAGTYHLFLDFKHRGEVRTAAFTVSTPGHAPEPEHVAADDGHDDH